MPHLCTGYVQKMKLLALIFLFGLATASIHDVLDDSDDQDIILKSGTEKGKGDLQTELGRKLKKSLDLILSHIKEAVKEGKGVSQELLDQVKDLVKKLKKYGVNVSDEAKDMLHYLKERFEKWADELIDIIEDDSNTVQRADDRVKEFGNKLKEQLKKVLHEIKKAVEEGKRVSRTLFDEAKELILRLKKYGVSVGDELKDMLEYLKTRVSEWAKELLDILQGKHEKRSIVDWMKELIERHGLKAKIEKLRELLTGKTDLSEIRDYIEKTFPTLNLMRERFIELLKGGKEKLRDFINKMLPPGDFY